MIRELFERYTAHKKGMEECNKEIGEYIEKYVEVVEKHLGFKKESSHFSIQWKTLTINGGFCYSRLMEKGVPFNFIPTQILIKSKLGFEIKTDVKSCDPDITLIDSERVVNLVNAIRELDDKLINEIGIIN